MRNPNGYGTVAKLSGQRRRPYIVKKTIGWNDKGHPIYDIIGYAETREAGNIMLAEYNRDPWDVDRAKITLQQLFDLWKEKKAPKLGESNRSSLCSAFKHCSAYVNKPYKQLRSYQMQETIDGCGKGYSTQAAIKNLWGELHPKSWTRKSTKGVQKSMGKELFSEELKLAVVQYVLEGHTCKEASEKFCVSCTPIEKWVNLYKLHGAKGLLSRNLVGRQKGFDGEFRLKVLQYKQEHHLSCTQTAMHFCLDVVTVCRWEKKFQKEGARGLMKKQATKGSEKRQKKQEQSELQQENKRLSEENYRLRMENDYLKKLNALIQKREKPE